MVDLYDQVIEIGTSILIKWMKEEVKGSGLKVGWYKAEVQAFEPNIDEITKESKQLSVPNVSLN